MEKSKIKICKVEGCDETVRARGYCHNCYNSKQNKGYFKRGKKNTCKVDGCNYISYERGYCKLCFKKIKGIPKKKIKICEVSGCDRKHYALGYCKPCYQKSRYTKIVKKIVRKRKVYKSVNLIKFECGCVSRKRFGPRVIHSVCINHGKKAITKLSVCKECGYKTTHSLNSKKIKSICKECERNIRLCHQDENQNRKYDCAYYDKCLDSAALKDELFKCDDCNRYKKCEIQFTENSDTHWERFTQRDLNHHRKMY